MRYKVEKKEDKETSKRNLLPGIHHIHHKVDQLSKRTEEHLQLLNKYLKSCDDVILLGKQTIIVQRH